MTNLITLSLLLAMAQVESAGRPSAIGDGGRARGALQIHRCVVVDVNRLHYPIHPQGRPRPRQGPADGLPVSLPLLLREEAGKEANTGGRGQGVGGWAGWMEGGWNKVKKEMR